MIMKNTIKLVALALFFILCIINVSIIANNSNDEGIIMKAEFLQAKAYIPPIVRDQNPEICPDPWNPATKFTCINEGSGCVPLDCP